MGIYIKDYLCPRCGCPSRRMVAEAKVTLAMETTNRFGVHDGHYTVKKTNAKVHKLPVTATLVCGGGHKWTVECEVTDA